MKGQRLKIPNNNLPISFREEVIKWVNKKDGDYWVGVMAA